MNFYSRFLVLFLCVASVGSASAAEFLFENPSKCVVLAKTVNVTVAATSTSKCCVTVPAELESAIDVSCSNGQVMVRQTAMNESKKSVNVLLPNTTKLSCWLTLRADVEILNEATDQLAPLDLNLFNGGVVTVDNGTYASSSITMQGLGFVDLNFVERGKPSSTLMDGITTLNTKSASKGFSMSGGGMSLGNGARMGFMSAGSRPPQLPTFDDVSLDDLYAYSLGTKKHPALARGWSNKFPGASFSAPYDDNLKEIIKNLSAQAVVPHEEKIAPAVSQQSREVPEELKKEVAAHIKEMQRDPLQYIQDVMDLLAKEDLGGATNNVAPQGVGSQDAVNLVSAKEDSDRAVLEEMIRNTRNLMLSDKIYEGRLAPGRHSYGLDAQVERISLLVNASAAEKEALWNLFLYRNMAFVNITRDQFNRILFKESMPLLDLYKKYHEKVLSLSEVAGSLGVGAVFGLLGYWVLSGGHVEDGMWRVWKDADPRNLPLKGHAISASVGAALSLAFVYSVNSNRDYIAINLEKTLALYKELIEKVSARVKDFPPHFATDFAALEQKLAQISYRKNGSIDYKKFAEYLDVVLEFYNDLGKKAGITT